MNQPNGAISAEESAKMNQLQATSQISIGCERINVENLSWMGAIRKQREKIL
jgi:predicted Fe-S protein YdhL (DUF1289 family)